MSSMYRAAITTALQFLASFRNVRVLSVGNMGNLCWVDLFADEDGTEEQHYFVMELRVAGTGQVLLKVIPNLSGAELYEAKERPLPFWDHKRAHTPQHGDDCAW